VPKTQANELPVRVSPSLPIDADAIIDYTNLRLQERKALTAIQVLAFANQYQKVAAAISKTLGIDCPLSPGICNANEHTQIAWNGPNSWMIIASDEESKREPGGLLKSLQKAVGNSGAVVDQSHGRCALRLSGTHARKVMAKNTAIDLHPLAFGPGKCALTSVAHMSALVIQVDDSPSYDLFVARSLARSFAHAIEHACHEFAND
jgi:heterotetrameric sarcosine oxidase gamma subunit